MTRSPIQVRRHGFFGCIGISAIFVFTLLYSLKALAICMPPDCNDNNLCTIDQCATSTVTQQQNCVHYAQPAGYPCAPDTNECTYDQCGGGADAGVCLHPNKPDGTACTGGTCKNGKCVKSCSGCVINGTCYENGADNPGNKCLYCDTSKSKTSWTAKTCSDGNACTTDTCDPAVGCVYTQKDCNDNNACTADTCSAGACINSPISNCCTRDADCSGLTAGCAEGYCSKEGRSASGTCAVRNAADGTGCSDGNACTTGDACGGGVCRGTPKAGCCLSIGDCAPSDKCHTVTACVLGAAPGGTCVEEAKTCAAPPTICYQSVGTCNPSDGNCQYALKPNVSGPTPTAEICDGKDNDCDGIIDNGVGTACVARVVPLPDGTTCQVDGLWGCSGTTIACIPDAEANGDDDGDGIPNQCDKCGGDDNLLDTACSIGDALCGGGGLYKCLDGKVTCNAKPKDNTVVCRDKAGPCDIAEKCTGGVCPPDEFALSDVVCRPSAGECDLAENCTGGGPACPGDLKKAAGVICADDGNVCTKDICNGTDVTCRHPFDDGASCNDGDKCTTGDKCQSGKCAGTVAADDMSRACQVGTCDPLTGGYLYTPVSNGTSCSDGRACTTGDVCTDGVCSGSVSCNTPPSACYEAVGVCGANGNCQYTLKANVSGSYPASEICDGKDNDCNGIIDDNPSGVGPAPDCLAATIPSVHNLCSTPCEVKAAKVCENGKLVCKPVSNNYDPCPSSLIPGNAEPVCAEGAVMTCMCGDYRCTAVSDLYTSRNIACDDKNLCTKNDKCVGFSCSGDIINCNDKNICTTDSCDPATGSCRYASNSLKCDDADRLTINDVCSGGKCSGTPVECLANSDCPGFFDPANKCLGMRRCDVTANKCVQDTATAVNTDDGIACTIDSCDPLTGIAVHTPDDAKCGDNNVCNGTERCDASAGCVAGIPFGCDDSDPCTIDGCDPSKGCLNTAKNCDDNNPLTFDVCVGGLCKNTIITWCGDGIKNGGEACDGADLGGAACQKMGFDEGSVSCNPDCTLNTTNCRNFVCGNDKIEGIEECDGTDLGGKTCSDMKDAGGNNYEGGILQCNGCRFSTSYCMLCGNNIKEPLEECDRTPEGVKYVFGMTDCSQVPYSSPAGPKYYTAGQLSCSDGCKIKCSTCGNGYVDSLVNGKDNNEACETIDGRPVDKDGKVWTCQDMHYVGGELKCSDTCKSFDTSLCTCDDGNVCTTDDFDPAKQNADGSTGGCVNACRVGEKIADNTICGLKKKDSVSASIMECAQIPVECADNGECPASGDPCNAAYCDTATHTCAEKSVVSRDIIKCDDNDPATYNDRCVTVTGRVTSVCKGEPVNCMTTADCEAKVSDACTVAVECVRNDSGNECRFEPRSPDDGDPCTIDSCSPSTGVRHTAVVCAAPADICLSAGVCNPSSGLCEYKAIDTDGDGTPDCTDECPSDPNFTVKNSFGECKSVDIDCAMPTNDFCAAYVAENYPLETDAAEARMEECIDEYLAQCRYTLPSCLELKEEGASEPKTAPYDLDECNTVEAITDGDIIQKCRAYRMNYALTEACWPEFNCGNVADADLWCRYQTDISVNTLTIGGDVAAVAGYDGDSEPPEDICMRKMWQKSVELGCFEFSCDRLIDDYCGGFLKSGVMVSDPANEGQQTAVKDLCNSNYVRDAAANKGVCLCEVAVCDDGNLCTTDGCDQQSGECLHEPNANPCDDGNACTIGDICQNGACAGGGPKSCDDGSICTSDSCNPADGSCINEAIDGCCITAEDCGDGNGCTIDECNLSNRCEYKPNPACCASDAQCDDGNKCTLDTCNLATGECLHKPQDIGTVTVGKGLCERTCLICLNGEPFECKAGEPKPEVCDGLDNDCDGGVDEDFADLGKPCSIGKGDCSNSGAIVCSGDMLTTVCSVTSAKPDGTKCGQQSKCRTDSVCAGGECQSGAPLSIDDNNPCTDDGCDETAGIYHINNTAACDDGNPCTENDVCGGGACGGSPKSCIGADKCSVGVCEPATGECLYSKKTCDVCSECSADTGLCEPLKTAECEAAEGREMNGASKIFDLSLTRAVYLPCSEVSDVQVTGDGDKQLLMIGCCTEASCGIAELRMKQFKEQMLNGGDGAAKGVAGSDQPPAAPEFTYGTKDNGVYLGGVVSVTEGSSGDLLTYDKSCIYIAPSISEQKVSGAQISETKICMPDTVCKGYEISGVWTGAEAIFVVLTCPDKKQQTVKLSINPEKKGELVMQLLSPSEPPPEEKGGIEVSAAGKEFMFGKDEMQEKVSAAFGAEFMRDDIEKAVVGGSFEALDKLNMLAGGLYSARNAVVSEEMELIPYDEKDEQYFCSSAIDNVASGGEYRFAVPSHLTRVSMKDYGGPDLMAICRLVVISSKADENALKAGTLKPKAIAAFFYPNANEAPSVDLLADGASVESGAAKASDEGVITLTAEGSDPTNDALVYSWTCSDRFGNDCGVMLTSLEGKAVKFVGEVADLSVNGGILGPDISLNSDIGKAADASSPAGRCPYTVTVKAVDPGGLSDSKSMTVNCIGGAKGIGGEPGPAASSFFADFIGGGCLMSLSDADNVSTEQKWIFPAGILLICAWFAIIRHRKRKFKSTGIYFSNRT